MTPWRHGSFCPNEAPDLTATEVHHRVLHRLFDVLRYLFRGRALVLADIFVRVDEAVQVASDLTIVHGATPGNRLAYRIPLEAVPDVTVEVLSTLNDTPFGFDLLEQKRALFGTIGVPVHLELDPDRGLVTTWRNVDGQLTAGSPMDRYDGDELAGLRIELSPGEVRLWRPDGLEFVDTPTEDVESPAIRSWAVGGEADAGNHRSIDPGRPSSRNWPPGDLRGPIPRKETLRPVVDQVPGPTCSAYSRL